MDMQCVGIITGPDTYLDHLGIFCYYMGIPLIVTERATYEKAREFYPLVNVVHKEMSELSFDFLAENFHVIFETGKFWMTELGPALGWLYKKKMRFVYCPHGNSDKGHTSKEHMAQDISLVYGDHMLDLLSRTGARDRIHSIVRTGNYRAQFYKEHRSFYQELAHKYLAHRLDFKKRTILYAPTWEDGENPSSFFSKTGDVVEQLSQEWNVLIKLHPFLVEHHPAAVYRIMGLYEHREGVVFLEFFPSIYPLLEIADLYIGDYSSIGYDFLFFDKPLYFFASDEKKIYQDPLHSCGLVLPESQKIAVFIRDTYEESKRLKSFIRKATYLYAFGEERPFTAIKEDLLHVCKGSVANYFSVLSPPEGLPHPHP